jgi:ankyrin repeat protein
MSLHKCVSNQLSCKQNGMSALHVAATFDAKEAAAELIEHGASLTLKTSVCRLAM